VRRNAIIEPDLFRCINTAVQEPEIDLAATHQKLAQTQDAIQKATAKHNEFPKELGLPLLPPD
jgi:type I restriction enzyme M protein